MDSFVSVYLDMAAGADAVSAAVARSPNPLGVLKVRVDDTVVAKLRLPNRRSPDGMLDDNVAAGQRRRYGEQLSVALGVPVQALCDLRRATIQRVDLFAR